MSAVRRFSLAFLLVLAMALPASATTVRVLGVGELTDHADLVVEGTVAGVEVVKTRAAPGIFTHYVVEVDRDFSGFATETVTLSIPGGKLDKREVMIEGMPVLTIGAHVLLILETLPKAAFDDGGAHHIPLGLGQGLFELDSSDTPTFKRRPSPISTAGFRPFCTGGEWVSDFDADELRRFLKARLAKGRQE